MLWFSQEQQESCLAIYVSGLDINVYWLALAVKVRFFAVISLRDLLHDLRKTRQNQQLVKEPFAWSLLLLTAGFHCTPYLCTPTASVLFRKHFVLGMILS